MRLKIMDLKVDELHSCSDSAYKMRQGNFNTLQSCD